MGKKVLKIIIILVIVLNLFSHIIYADDEDGEELNYNDLEEVIETAGETVDEPSLNAKSAIIYDRTSKRVIWEKNENQKRAMASTTKIMTAILVLERGNLNDIVEVSGKAAGTRGSRLGLKKGDKITLNDLLYGLMLSSRKRCCSPNSRVYRRKYRRFCRANEQKGKRTKFSKYAFCNTKWIR